MQKNYVVKCVNKTLGKTTKGKKIETPSTHLLVIHLLLWTSTTNYRLVVKRWYMLGQ